MPQIVLQNPQVAKIIEFVIENWQFCLMILGLSIIGLGWPHQMDERP